MSLSVGTFEETEEAALQAVASRYQRRGYQVFVRPPGEMLPKDLRRFRPEILARGPHENVVVEVKSRSSLGKDGRLAAIARTIEAIPGWRFELVIANPEVDRSVPLDEPTLTKRQILQQLDEAAQLEAGGHKAAALVLAGSAAEAALRHKSRGCGLKPDGQSGISLAKSLYSIGEITKATYENITAALQSRNTLVHGFRVRPADEMNVDRVKSEVRKLLANGETARAQ